MPGKYVNGYPTNFAAAEIQLINASAAPYGYDIERRATMGRTVHWYAIEYRDGYEICRKRTRSSKQALETIRRWREARRQMEAEC